MEDSAGFATIDDIVIVIATFRRRSERAAHQRCIGISRAYTCDRCPFVPGRRGAIGIHAALLQEVPRWRSVRIRALGIAGQRGMQKGRRILPRSGGCFRGSTIAREEVNQMVVNDLFQARHNRVKGGIGSNFGRINDQFFAPDQVCILTEVNHVLEEPAEDIESRRCRMRLRLEWSGSGSSRLYSPGTSDAPG